jgi:hypothetical protein
MHRLTGTLRWSRIGVAGLAVALGIAAWAAGPAPAAAQFWFGFGPRYYAPYPYYYAPPAYYPYYAPPAYYPPQAPADYPPSAPGAAAEPQGGAAITYTNRPAFRNAAGQTCREYRGPNGALGTACADASGQWRVAN